MELKYCLVTQNIASVVEDSLTDSDRLPDIELASGDVTFIPNVPTGGSYQIELTNGQWYSVPLGRIRAKIVNGKIYHEGKPGVYLYAAGSGSNPSKISYNVSYSNLRAGGIPFSLNSFTFQAVPDGEVDLTLVKPVPGVSPAGTIRGPRGTSLESIEVDDSHLVFTTVNEAGSFEMARIPISHVVEAEAREAARQAAENVAELTTSNLEASENFKNQAGAHADRAEAAADDTVADARAQLVGYVESAQTSATSADASDKSAAAHRAAAKTSETNAKSSETKAKASETKATTEANRSETARTGSEAAQGKAENAAVKAEGMRDSAATHSASAERSKTAASQSASEAKASETRAQELADAFDVEGLRAEIEARIADLVDGAPDALNTLREIAELASSNKTVQEQLTEAIAGKADKTHTHSQSQVTGLSTALNNKADKTHTHETSQVVGLDNALTGKADKAHTHAQGDVTGLSTSLSNKADKTHTHTQAQVTGLSTALGGKADKSHTHAQGDITGLSTALSGKADKSHTHASADISDAVSAAAYTSTRANRVVKTAADGMLHSDAYPREDTHLVHKRHLDLEVAKKADKSHTHASADITDAFGHSDGSSSMHGRLARWDSAGGLRINRDPNHADELARRGYVDNKAQEIADGKLDLTTLGVQDLNTVTTPGFYYQNRNVDAAASDNYPSDRAGYLEVWSISDWVYQRYTDYQRNQVWIRTKYGSTWYTWVQLAMQSDVDREIAKKADASHTHSQSDITGLSTTLSGKADSTHTHTQGEVTGLTAALNGKAAKSHTHTTSQISGLSTALNGKANKTYVDSRPALFSGVGAPPSSISGAVVGDFWLDTDTMELHKITGV